MTVTTFSAPSPIGRIARATPVVGRVIRDIEREVDTVYYLVTIFVTAVVLAVQTWGLPALVLTALALVPVMFVLLIILAKP
jgi:hypothetical protein